MLSFLSPPVTKLSFESAWKFETSLGRTFHAVDSGGKGPKECSSSADFEYFYSLIEEEIKEACLKYPDLVIQITLKGKLNSQDIDETFYDLLSCKQWLQSRNLLTPQSANKCGIQ